MPTDDLPLLAARKLSAGGVPYLGLVLVLIGGFLLWRSARQSNTSARQERQGGVVFVVLGCLIVVVGLANLWSD
jgi:hypothetical protein